MTSVLITVIIVRVVWIFTILLGTAYIVFWLNYSGWWWVLAIILISGASGDATVKTKREP